MQRSSDHGSIPDGWQRVRLGDICSPPEYGASAPACDYDSKLPRYVRITDITDDGRLRSEDPKSADPDLVEGYELYPGDLLFARSGSVGRTYLHRPRDGKCVFAGYLIRFRPAPDVALPEYLEQWTHSNSYYSWVASIARRGAQTNINATEYSSSPILLPPLPEQRAIAAVLDSIDDAIEGAEAVIAATEGLRDALLHDLLTRGLPGQHTEFRDVPGLGTIPADWDVVRLGDAGKWYSGGTPSKSRADYWVGSVPWVSPKDMKSRVLWNFVDFISDEAAAQGSRIVPPESVFVVVRGMILAKSFPIAIARVQCAFNQDMRALICGGRFDAEFVLSALEWRRPALLNLPTPSTHGTMRVVTEDLYNMTIPVPSFEEQVAIRQLIAETAKYEQQSRKALQELNTLKGSTADALLTGQLRMRDGRPID